MSNSGASAQRELNAYSPARSVCADRVIRTAVRMVLLVTLEYFIQQSARWHEPTQR